MAADIFFYFPSPAKGASGNIQPAGESQDKALAQYKPMQIQALSFGMENPTTIGSMSGGAGAGKAKFNEFTVSKSVDTATPSLFSACGQGAHFPTAILIVRKAGGSQVNYLQYQFNMVFVTKMEWSIDSGGDPVENVTFVFGAMGIQYAKQNPDGSAGAKSQIAWSQVTNQPTLAGDPSDSGSPAYLNP